MMEMHYAGYMFAGNGGDDAVAAPLADELYDAVQRFKSAD